MKGKLMNTMLNQDHLPLWEAISAYRDKGAARLHMPGHKGSAGFPEPLRSAWGTLADFDITELAESDDLYDPVGPLRESQRLLADLYGCAESFYLVNGASVGLIAALLASTQGQSNGGCQKVLLPREAHRSLWHGCVLADLWPVCAEIFVEEESAVALPPSLEALETVLMANPDLKAAVMLHPSFYGLTGDLQPQVALLHEHGIPVIVDEAHGAHMRFLPQPLMDGLQCGADVVIQSPHKTAGSLTQTAWMHSSGGLIDSANLHAALRLLHTSSPSFPLLLSLEAARRQLALEGTQLWSDTMARVARLQLQIARSDKLTTLSGWLPPVLGKRRDPSKMYILTRGAGYSGHKAAELLRSWGVSAELADAGGVLLMFSPGDTDATFEILSETLARLDEYALPAINPLMGLNKWPQLQRLLSPRQAWQSTTKAVSLTQATGRIVAEVIAAYPPGVPLISPGELITDEVVEIITEMLPRIPGGIKETLQIKVVDE
ncbi:MAG: hypothetical protein FWE76_08035 [Symbiobacteriaceae bacterium]|nr:hypothetical protein [Symbiobacteriaceae bacterium]